MNLKPLSEAQDDDVRQVLDALQRAANQAKKIALQTQTAIVVMRDGKIMFESANNKSSQTTQ